MERRARRPGPRALGASVVLATALSSACSGSDVNTPGASAGGAAAQTGGAGGVSGFNSGGAGPSGGSSGQGGTTAPAAVFNPGVAVPSYDCRTDTSKRCVSIAGTVSGAPIDLHCSMPDSPALVLGGQQERWPVYCVDDPTGGTGWRYEADVPVRVPGGYTHPIVPGLDPAGANVVLEHDMVGGDAHADNFTGGELSVVVTKDPATQHDIVVGTFRATWSAPGQNCDGFTVDTCAAMDVNGTFRGDNYITTSLGK